jgi:hypothetical protein
MLYLNPIQEIEVRTQLLRVAARYNHIGEWERVKDIVSTQPFSPYNVLAEHLKDRSPHDFFGNEFKYIQRILRTVKWKNPYMPSEHRVKRPQRKRGYDDKGHPPRDLRPARKEPGERPEVPEVQPSHRTFWDKFERGHAENLKQETLVVDATSWSSEKNSGLRGQVFLDSPPESQESKVESFDPRTHEQNEQGKIIPRRTSFFH